MQTLEKGQKSGYGKVKRIIYVCAFVLSEGGLMGSLQFKPLPWLILDVCLSTTASLLSKKPEKLT